MYVDGEVLVFLCRAQDIHSVHQGLDSLIFLYPVGHYLAVWHCLVLWAMVINYFLDNLQRLEIFGCLSFALILLMSVWKLPLVV